MENAAEYYRSQCRKCVHDIYPLARGIANDIKIRCDYYDEPQQPRGTAHTPTCEHYEEDTSDGGE